MESDATHHLCSVVPSTPAVPCSPPASLWAQEHLRAASWALFHSLTHDCTRPITSSNLQTTTIVGLESGGDQSAHEDEVQRTWSTTWRWTSSRQSGHGCTTLQEPSRNHRRDFSSSEFPRESVWTGSIRVLYRGTAAHGGTGDITPPVRSQKRCSAAPQPHY